jgi:hypothetical protein
MLRKSFARVGIAFLAGLGFWLSLGTIWVIGQVSLHYLPTTILEIIT